MERRHGIVLAGCGIGLVLAVSGCRTPSNEVPPGKKYMTDGRVATPPASFSGQDPRPADAASPPSPYGGAPGAMNNYGAPTGNGYGQMPYVSAGPATGGAPGSPASLGVNGAASLDGVPPAVVGGMTAPPTGPPAAGGASLPGMPPQ